uniref:PH domain-containing protein n=1 Tax=Chromera velia CCMP2878 TaxID=1169474 RepID=A0A0G4FI56_9ALVE|eukprot:Cvel_17109.t1-p1 / transcript=Cvel_17109.t1 / gene=Cvel_17109 / organism=Chromera_velia_CCMP2878 / gene_product=hypothetical protein / transcript_product=hypothetical protein / location=Cvel_scaffold1349:7950-12716(+) / protein_length=1143 / sequence_SO=supercontig / SO=protein_coding / is_pseudo=false
MSIPWAPTVKEQVPVSQSCLAPCALRLFLRIPISSLNVLSRGPPFDFPVTPTPLNVALLACIVSSSASSFFRSPAVSAGKHITVVQTGVWLEKQSRYLKRWRKRWVTVEQKQDHELGSHGGQDVAIDGLSLPSSSPSRTSICPSGDASSGTSGGGGLVVQTFTTEHGDKATETFRVALGERVELSEGPRGVFHLKIPALPRELHVRTESLLCFERLCSQLSSLSTIKCGCCEGHTPIPFRLKPPSRPFFAFLAQLPPISRLFNSPPPPRYPLPLPARLAGRAISAGILSPSGSSSPSFLPSFTTSRSPRGVCPQKERETECITASASGGLRLPTQQSAYHLSIPLPLQDSQAAILVAQDPDPLSPVLSGGNPWTLSLPPPDSALSSSRTSITAPPPSACSCMFCCGGVENPAVAALPMQFQEAVRLLLCPAPKSPAGMPEVFSRSNNWPSSFCSSFSSDTPRRRMRDGLGRNRKRNWGGGGGVCVCGSRCWRDKCGGVDGTLACDPTGLGRFTRHSRRPSHPHAGGCIPSPSALTSVGPHSSSSSSSSARSGCSRYTSSVGECGPLLKGSGGVQSLTLPQGSAPLSPPHSPSSTACGTAGGASPASSFSLPASRLRASNLTQSGGRTQALSMTSPIPPALPYACGRGAGALPLFGTFRGLGPVGGNNSSSTESGRGGGKVHVPPSLLPGASAQTTMNAPQAVGAWGDGGMLVQQQHAAGRNEGGNGCTPHETMMYHHPGVSVSSGWISQEAAATAGTGSGSGSGGESGRRGVHSPLLPPSSFPLPPAPPVGYLSQRSSGRRLGAGRRRGRPVHLHPPSCWTSLTSLLEERENENDNTNSEGGRDTDGDCTEGGQRERRRRGVPSITEEEDEDDRKKADGEGQEDIPPVPPLSSRSSGDWGSVLRQPSDSPNDSPVMSVSSASASQRTQTSFRGHTHSLTPIPNDPSDQSCFQASSQWSPSSLEGSFHLSSERGEGEEEDEEGEVDMGRRPIFGGGYTLDDRDGVCDPSLPPPVHVCRQKTYTLSAPDPLSLSSALCLRRDTSQSSECPGGNEKFVIDGLPSTPATPIYAGEVEGDVAVAPLSLWEVDEDRDGSSESEGEEDTVREVLESGEGNAGMGDGHDRMGGLRLCGAESDSEESSPDSF